MTPTPIKISEQARQLAMTFALERFPIQIHKQAEALQVQLRSAQLEHYAQEIQLLLNSAEDLKRQVEEANASATSAISSWLLRQSSHGNSNPKTKNSPRGIVSGEKY